MARLFIAAWPPPHVIARLEALRRPDVEGLSWTPAHQWHVTLCFLGEADAGSVIEALNAVAGGGEAGAGEAGAGAIEASLGPAVSRFGQKVLYVPVAGLDRLTEAVSSVVPSAAPGTPAGAIGLRGPRSFVGHLTLARMRQGVVVDLDALAGERVEATWPVEQVCLVRSRLGPAGSTYEVLARTSVRNYDSGVPTT